MLELFLTNIKLWTTSVMARNQISFTSSMTSFFHTLLKFSEQRQTPTNFFQLLVIITVSDQKSLQLVYMKYQGIKGRRRPLLLYFFNCSNNSRAYCRNGYLSFHSNTASRRMAS